MIEKGLHPANSARMDASTRRMIADPGLWPSVVLPMKRRTDPMLFGTMNRYQAKAAAAGGLCVILLDDAHVEAYPTVDQALAAGWTVD